MSAADDAKREAQEAKMRLQQQEADSRQMRAEAMKANAATNAAKAKTADERAKRAYGSETESSAVDKLVEEDWGAHHVYMQGEGWFTLEAGEQLWRHDPDGAAMTEAVRKRFPRDDEDAGLVRAATIKGVLALASAHPHFRRRSVKFDAFPDVVGLPSGRAMRLDDSGILETGQLAYVTKRMGCDPKEGQPARFLQFLGEVLTAAEDVHYLQRWLGYALTGHVREAEMIYFHGKGRNGKGVLLQILQAAFGEYHQSVAADKLLADDKHGGAHLEWLAKLRGARLITADELPDRPWQVNRLKQLIAGDKQTANFMRQNSFDFHPEGAFILAGNYMPKIRGGVDYAMAERMRIIDFPYTFPRDERNRKLAQDIIREELPQIANWICRGAMDYLDLGLQEETEAIRRMAREFMIGAKTPVSEWAESLHYSDYAWCASADLIESANAAGIMCKRIRGEVHDAINQVAEKRNSRPIRQKVRKISEKAVRGFDFVAVKEEDADKPLFSNEKSVYDD